MSPQRRGESEWFFFAVLVAQLLCFVYPLSVPSRGVCPLRNSSNDGDRNNAADPSESDEARKLFYVAMTRARESLTFTSARHYGSGIGYGRTSAAGHPEQECLFVSEAVDSAASDANSYGSADERTNLCYTTCEDLTSAAAATSSVAISIVPADPRVAKD